MNIDDVKIKISEIESSDPDIFSFLFDTTDRSFIYKSKISDPCEQLILELDQSKGIDLLTKKNAFYIEETSTTVLALKEIGPNAFVGFCCIRDECTTSLKNLVKQLEL